MDAADLAREVCAYNNLLDRPSRLDLTVWPIGSIRGLKEFTLQVTTPVENGQQLVRCYIPPFPPPRSRRTVLDYNSTTNLEGAAAFIDGYITLTGGSLELRLYEAMEQKDYFEGDCLLGRFPVNNEDGSNIPRIQRILSALKSLFIY